MPSLDFIEIETATPAQSSIIWLHGLGADGHDFAGILPELNLPKNLAVRFIFPHAPVQPVTINNGMSARAWYDIYALDSRMREDDVGIRLSRERFHELIEHEHARGIPYEKIILAGFSQGGAMALFTGLSFPHKLAGIMALSCYVPIRQHLENELSSANQNIPIFMAHGTHDMLLPLPLAQMSHQFLLSKHYPVEWHTYAMEHSVCYQEVKDISHWIQKVV